MAHFAKVNDENIVESVIVIGNDDCAGGDFPQAEEAGQHFIASIGLEGRWLQTSYTGRFRGRFAGIGYTYVESTDEFTE